MPSCEPCECTLKVYRPFGSVRPQLALGKATERAGMCISSLPKHKTRPHCC